MKWKKWIRRGLWSTLLGAVLLLVIAAVYPLWLPSVLIYAGSRFGVYIGSVESSGYTGLSIREIAWQQEGVRVAVDTVELPSLWNGLTDKTSRHIQLSGVVVDVQPDKFPSDSMEEEPAPPKSPANVMSQVFGIVEQIKGYGLTATYEDVLVRVGEHYIQSAKGTFDSKGQVELSAAWLNNPVQVDLQGTLAAMDIQVIGWGGELFSGRITQEVSSGAYSVLFDGHADRQPLRISYASGATDWMPTAFTANLVLNDEGIWRARYLPVESLSGEIDLIWKEKEWSLAGEAYGVADGEKYQLAEDFPVNLQIKGRGTLELVEIESFSLNLPFAQARLEHPTNFSLREVSLEQRTKWGVTFDLSKLPERFAQPYAGDAVLEMHPLVSEEDATSGVELVLDVDVKDLEDKDVGGANLLLTVTPERVVVKEMVADIPGILNAKGKGEYWIQQKEFRKTSFAAEADRRLGDLFLPDTITVGEISARGEIAGTIDALEGELKLRVGGVSVPQQEFSVIEVDLKATAEKIFNLQAQLEGQPVTMRIEADGRFDLGFLDIEFSRADLAFDGQAFALEEKASLFVHLGDQFGLSWTNWVWSGKNDARLVTHGKYEDDKLQTFSLAADELSGTLVNTWLPAQTELKNLLLHRLRVASRLNEESIVEWTAEGLLSYEEETRGTADLSFNMGSFEEGVLLEKLELTYENQPLLFAQGTLPVTLMWKEAPGYVLDKEAPLQTVLEIRENTALLNMIGELADITISDLKLSAALRGTLERPEGLINASAGEVATNLAAAGRPLVVSQPSVALTIDRDALDLRKFELTVREGYLSGNLRYGLRKEDWVALWEKKFVFDPERLEGSFVLSETSFEGIAAFAPTFFAREGTISANLNISEGFQMQGLVNLEGVSTRTLPNGYRMTNLSADIALDRRKLILHEISGRMGTHPIYLRGEADFADLKNPKGEITIRGENIPLARSDDLLIRSDIDLQLTMRDLDSARITGEVNLRDSLLFMDIADMTRRGPATPTSRPPYFSVEHDLVGDWRLNVRVRGNQFMKIDSTAFRGVVSIDMNLEGTLREPQAIGELQINRGTVRFPFGRLQMQTGYVRITRDNPYEPRLDITAEGRTFGYQVDMTVSGTASSPEIQFASVPSATDNELLLMLSTGAIPSGNVLTTSQRTAQAALYFTQDLIGDFFDLPIEEKLSIESGRDISEQGRTTLELEYELNDKWSLTGEYDKFDQYNAGVKWRFFSR